jgi:uncharacterized membrane protein YeaQ/YmgE (transglycosylase-associated protein family)
MWGVISWILFGLIAGGIAKFIMPGKDPGGCLVTAAIGMIGALLGGFLAGLAGYGGVSGFDLYSLLLAIVGAILLLIVYRIFVGRQSRP